MTKSEILKYISEDKSNEIQVRLEGDTIWLSQRQMSELFEKDSDRGKNTLIPDSI